MMKYVQLYLLVYVIVVGLIYGLTKRSGIPKLLPGDFYINKNGKTSIYIPTGASFIITSIVFLILYSILN